MDKKKSEYSPSEILKGTGRLFAYDYKYALTALAGATITALVYYLLRLFNGMLYRSAVNSALIEKNFWPTIIFIGLGYALARVPNAFGFYFNSKGAAQLCGKFQTNLVDRWLRQEEKGAKNRHSGEIIQRLTGGCLGIFDFFFQGGGLKIVMPVVAGIASLITVIAVNWRFAAYLLIIGALSAFTTTRFTKSLHKRRSAYINQHESMTSAFSNLFSGAASIKLMGIEKQSIDDGAAVIDELNRQSFSIDKLEETEKFLSNFFKAAGMVGCIAIAALLSAGGTFTFANVMLIIPMQEFVIDMLASLGKGWTLLSQTSVNTKRVFDYLEIPVEDERKELVAHTKTGGAPALEFDKVSFSYDGTQPVLENFSFSVKKGEKSAITGGSGSGKSTVFALALDYIQADKGKVRLFGMEAKECSLSSWRENFALIQQESPMLDMSIADNIAIGCLGSGRQASREEIIEAAKKAGAHDFITALPDGYDTMPGEQLASSLSGGQRQRIAIARAFLSKAPIILMDEASSALDAENEQLIVKAVEGLAGERTVLAIAHRLTTVKDFNNITVIDKGSAVETGSHSELLEQNGVYAKLWSLATQAQ